MNGRRRESASSAFSTGPGGLSGRLDERLYEQAIQRLARRERSLSEMRDFLEGLVERDGGQAASEADALKLEGAIMKVVDEQLGAVARPARVRFVSVLPKTRSGKLLRRAIQAVCEGRDPGDLTTMEDPAALQQVKDLVTR